MKALGQIREIEKLLDKEGVPKYTGSAATIDRVARLIHEQQIRLRAARSATQMSTLTACHKMIMDVGPVDTPKPWAITAKAQWAFKWWLLDTLVTQMKEIKYNVSAGENDE